MKQILVIQNKRIGDVLIASILANNLKKVLPDSHITYFVYDYTAGVLEHNQNIDQVILANDKQLKKLPVLWKTIRAIRKRKYDIIFDPYAKFQSRMMCLFSKAPMRVGFKRKHKKLKLPFYTQAVDFLDKVSLPCGKAIEDRLHMIQQVLPLENPDPWYKIHLTAEEQAYSGIAHLKKPVVMFGVLGSSPNKSLPYAYTVQLVDYLCEHFDVEVLFNYAPHQRQEAKAVYAQCKYQEAIHMEVYESSIRGFITLMNQCAFLISNEGGSVHIAKALNRPTFTIYSPYIDKSNWNSFEDGTVHESVHLLEEKPNLFDSYTLEERRSIEKDPQELYRQLTPEMILKKLAPYLAHHLKDHRK